MYLIQSSNVYKQTELLVSDSTCQCSPLKGNIGSLPTLFNQDGSFNHEANKLNWTSIMNGSSSPVDGLSTQDELRLGAFKQRVISAFL
ncbi:hypothetical protein G6Z90_13115 [Vibrio aestuarianus subsp. cardii]|nr:hypothetical protein [Vibrio aestuarianus subsp. cardii]